MAQISNLIGNQIRLFRKTRHMTLDQFSALLHKSKSTISKYENGEIAIDIETLYEISNCLKIDIRQLLADVDLYRAEPPNIRSGFFSRHRQYYIYYFLNRTNKNVTKSLLEIYGDAEDLSSVLFSDVQDFDTPNHCRHLYYGDIHYSDTFVNLSMQNQDNNSERIFLNIINTFGQETITTGLLSGTSSKYLIPISIKVLISQSPIPEDSDLIEQLRITNKDISAIRKTSCFSIDRIEE